MLKKNVNAAWKIVMKKNSVYPCSDHVNVAQVLDKIVEEIKFENRGAVCLSER